MPIDNVPWMVEGGVEHSTNIARLVSYLAAGGLEGVVAPTDLEVRELAVPGTSVRIAPGACAIANRDSKQDAYVARCPDEITLAISPSGSGGRTDMVVAIIKNPWPSASPWPDPEPGQEQDYPYFDIIAVPNPNVYDTVDELGLGYSAIPLANITLPPFTATITTALITDLRRLIRPGSTRLRSIAAPTGTNHLNNAEFDTWATALSMTVDIPSEATHLQALAIAAGVGFGGAGDNSGNGWNVAGGLRIELRANSQSIFGQSTNYNVSNGGGTDRATLMAGTPPISIPRAMRGLTGTLRVQGRKTGGNTDVYTDTASMCSLEAEFIQRTESNS